MTDYEAMGRRIRRKRQEKGLTQGQFAAKVGLSPSFYGHIERGSRVPSLDTLIIIANELGVGLDTLLRDSLKIQVPNDRGHGLNRSDAMILRSYFAEQLNVLAHWSDTEDEPSGKDAQD